MQPNDPLEKPKEMMKSTLMFGDQHWRISLSVALISIVSIALFTGTGYYLDLYFATKPAFLIVGVIISFPVSLYGIYAYIQKKYIPHLKKLK